MSERGKFLIEILYQELRKYDDVTLARMTSSEYPKLQRELARYELERREMVRKAASIE